MGMTVTYTCDKCGKPSTPCYAISYDSYRCDNTWESDVEIAVTQLCESCLCKLKSLLRDFNFEEMTMDEYLEGDRRRSDERE